MTTSSRDQCTGIIFLLIGLASVLQTNAYSWRTRRQAEMAAAGGTTRNIQDIFMGRCFEHTQCLLTDQCQRRRNVDCEQIWDEFLSAFQYQDPCNTTADAYDSVLKIAPPITTAGQTLFWSGLLDAALNVARVSKQHRILEETLPGYMANKLMWCGDPNSVEGINYTKCPSSYDCNGETGYTFWRAASREFARQAYGKVSVALNAHREGGAFKNTSTFATIELPNLDPNKVDFVEIMLVPDIKLAETNKSFDTCNTGTTLELKRRIKDAGMNWTCTFDPLEFRFIQCTTLENPLDYPACSAGYSIAGINIWCSLILYTFVYVLKQLVI